MANTQNITTGIKAIKISKIDSFGNDQTLQLQELNTLRIYFDDLGILNFDVVSIAEYSTYFLLYVVPTTIGNDLSFFKNPILPKKIFAGDSDSYWVSGSSPHGVFRSYQTKTGVSGSLGESSGNYFLNNNPIDPYTIQVTCSFDVKFNSDPFSTGNPIIVMMSGSYTDPDTLTTYPNILGASYVNLPTRTTSSFYPVTCSFTVNPGYVWSNGSGQGLNNYFNGVAPDKISPVYTSTFGLYFQNPTPGTSWSFLVQTGSINVTLNQLHTSSNDINGNLTVIEPYYVENYQISDYNVLINNAVLSRENDFFMDVDFDSSDIVAVNEQSILNGSATRATVQESNYTTARVANPRYYGSRSTSPGFNLVPTTGGYSSEESNVEQNVQCFLYTPGGRGNSLAERSGSGNYLIGFAIDENGDIYKPTSNTGSLYLPIMYNSFAAGTPVILSRIGSGNTSFSNDTVYPVYKPLVNSQTILRSDTGSLDQNYLVNGFLSSISMSIVPGVNTNIGAAADGGNLTSLSVGVETTASNFGTVTLNSANAFTASSGIYKYPNQGYSSLRASVTASVVYDVSALGVPPNTTVTMRIYGNNNVIATRSQTATQGSSTNIFAGVSASILVSPGDTYYATISTNNLDLDNFSTDFVLLPSTGSNGTGSFSTSYFTTGSNSRNVLTASAGMTSLYGGNWQQQDTLINGTSSGFSNIQPFIVNPLDEIRFNGNESQVYLISTSSYSAVNDRVYFYLNNNISPTSGINLNYFAIRRWIFSLDNLLIDTPGTIMGEGFIIPFNSSPEFKTKIDIIAKQLQKDGLI